LQEIEQSQLLNITQRDLPGTPDGPYGNFPTIDPDRQERDVFTH
jgi:hypothetical protein